jgi:hypothetical protein
MPRVSKKSNNFMARVPGAGGNETGRSGNPANRNGSKPINLLGMKTIMPPSNMASRVKNKFQMGK